MKTEPAEQVAASEVQTPTDSNSIFHRAAGNLSFLMSVIRCGESLSEDEAACVRRTIQELGEHERASTGAVSIPDAEGKPMNDFEARAGIATQKIRDRLSQDKREAARIASWMANTFYPQQEFALLDSLSGILSQIDNMLVGIQRRVSIPDAISEVRKLRDTLDAEAKNTEEFRADHRVKRRAQVGALDAAIERLRSLSPSAGTEDAESAWLIEKGPHEGRIWYITADRMLEWTDDPNKAIRLSRREDAEMLCTIVEDADRIAEHEWVPPAQPASKREG